MPCLAEMKGLVSTALTLTIWSIVREKLQVWTWTNIHSQVRNAISQNWWVISWVNFDPWAKIEGEVGALSQVEYSFMTLLYQIVTVLLSTDLFCVVTLGSCENFCCLMQLIMIVQHQLIMIVHWTHPQTNLWSPASPLKWVIEDRSESEGWHNSKKHPSRKVFLRWYQQLLFYLKQCVYL